MNTIINSDDISKFKSAAQDIYASKEIGEAQKREQLKALFSQYVAPLQEELSRIGQAAKQKKKDTLIQHVKEVHDEIVKVTQALVSKEKEKQSPLAECFSLLNEEADKIPKALSELAKEARGIVKKTERTREKIYNDAEIFAIRDAIQKVSSERKKGNKFYVVLDPQDLTKSTFTNKKRKSSSMLDLAKIINAVALQERTRHSSVHRYKAVEEIKNGFYDISGQFEQKYQTFFGRIAQKISSYFSRTKAIIDTTENIFKTLTFVKEVPTYERAVDSLKNAINREIPKPPQFYQDIAKHSRLRTAETVPGIDRTVFAHIHGDTFVGETGLEGSNPSIILDYAQKFIANNKEKYGNTPFAHLVNTGLASANQIPLGHEVPQLKGSYKAYIATQLETGKPFLIPGGWKGKPGHAMYYEVIPQTDGKFKMRIYNTGSGLQFHPKAWFDSKWQYLPYIEYGDIPKESFTKDAFIIGLLEFACVDKIKVENREEQIIYEPSEIYNNFLPCLEGRLLPYSEDLNEYIVEQHSGICAWAGFLAMARNTLPFKSEIPGNFMRFRMEIGLESLVQFYRGIVKPSTNENETPIEARERLAPLVKDEQARMLLEKSVESFAKNTLEAFGRGMITEEELTTCYATCEEIRQDIHKATQLFLEETALNVPVELQALEGNPIPAAYGTLPTVTGTSLTDESRLAKLKNVELPWDFSKVDLKPEQTASFLTNFYKTACSAYQQQRSPVAIVDAMQCLFDKLPIPTNDKEDFWAQIPKEQRHACMEQLCKMTEMLVHLERHLCKENNPNTDELLVTYKALAIQHRLAALDVVDGEVSKEILDLTMMFDEVEIFLKDFVGDHNFYETEKKQQFEKIKDYYAKNAKAMYLKYSQGDSDYIHYSPDDMGYINQFSQELNVFADEESFTNQSSYPFKRRKNHSRIFKKGGKARKFVKEISLYFEGREC